MDEMFCYTPLVDSVEATYHALAVMCVEQVTISDFGKRNRLSRLIDGVVVSR
jgi:hypothetical protein